MGIQLFIYQTLYVDFFLILNAIPKRNASQNCWSVFSLFCFLMWKVLSMLTIENVRWDGYMDQHQKMYLLGLKCIEKVGDLNCVHQIQWPSWAVHLKITWAKWPNIRDGLQGCLIFSSAIIVQFLALFLEGSSSENVWRMFGSLIGPYDLSLKCVMPFSLPTASSPVQVSCLIRWAQYTLHKTVYHHFKCIGTISKGNKNFGMLNSLV